MPPVLRREPRYWSTSHSRRGMMARAIRTFVGKCLSDHPGEKLPDDQGPCSHGPIEKPALLIAPVPGPFLIAGRGKEPRQDSPKTS